MRTEFLLWADSSTAAAGPSAPLRDRKWRSGAGNGSCRPFGSAQGPERALRGRGWPAAGLLVFWAVGPVVIDVVAVGSHRTG